MEELLWHCAVVFVNKKERDREREEKRRPYPPSLAHGEIPEVHGGPTSSLLTHRQFVVSPWENKLTYKLNLSPCVVIHYASCYTVHLILAPFQSFSKFFFRPS